MHSTQVQQQPSPSTYFLACEALHGRLQIDSGGDDDDDDEVRSPRNRNSVRKKEGNLFVCLVFVKYIYISTKKKSRHSSISVIDDDDGPLSA